MTPPWFLERMTAADWTALGISNHRQLRMNLAERVRTVGVDAVAAKVAMSAFAAKGWAMQPYVREQLLGYLAEVEWGAVTAPSVNPATTPATPLSQLL